MNELLKLLVERHTSRVPFDRRCPIAVEDLRLILEAARWAPLLSICRTSRSSSLMTRSYWTR